MTHDELAALFVNYQPWLQHYFAKCVDGDDDLVDDLAGDCWLKLTEACARVRGDGSHYLKRTAHNRQVDLHRTRGRRPDPVELREWHSVTGPPSASVEMLADELHAQLSDEQRQVTRLLLAGYAWNDIGPELGLLDSVVAARIHRARQKMREAWRRMEANP